MPFTQDLFDALDLASITVDEALVESVEADFRRTPGGTRASFRIIMKEDAVAFPADLKEGKFSWMME